MKRYDDVVEFCKAMDELLSTQGYEEDSTPREDLREQLALHCQTGPLATFVNTATAKLETLIDDLKKLKEAYCDRPQ